MNIGVVAIWAQASYPESVIGAPLARMSQKGALWSRLERRDATYGGYVSNTAWKSSVPEGRRM